MNLVRNKSTEIRKQVFTLKPIKKDGLILQIHHTVFNRNKSRRIRFLYSSFDNSGLVLASADIDGNIFIVEFSSSKFWSLPKFYSCSVLAFSVLNQDELIVGTNDGHLYLTNIQSGDVSGLLEGHKYPVREITFDNEQCLTASYTQAIIFDLRNRNKVHVLTLESNAALKHLVFMPVSHHILACFANDFIHVWKNSTFEAFKQILPGTWAKVCLRCIAFTRNGRLMVLAGHSPILAVFSLDTWELIKILNLPTGINSVKSIDFVSQVHDGGANKYLIVLSNDGIIYFLDMEKSVVIGKIQKDSEIISFTCAPNGNHLACILHSGEVNVYKLDIYTEANEARKREEIRKVPRGKLKLYLPVQKHRVRDELDINKLRGILKVYGEYPESYRSLIWTKVLELPNNKDCYTAVINKGSNAKFIDFEQKYPLINKSLVKNLKRLLINLANWCPIFSYVEFLPIFVFPFIKIFVNDPVLCFETVCTVIWNFCQHWFEYAPYPPINVLAMIENVLIEHDQELLSHLTAHEVTSQIYGWSILEAAFSEILTIKEWCILWDHIISNEPSFLLMVVVAYNILCRTSLLALNKLSAFKVFYHSQNPINMKKLISKSYYLLKNTSEARHPRKYLKPFEKLPSDSYPVFDKYPKTILEYENQSENAREYEKICLDDIEEQILKQNVIAEKNEKDAKIREEESKRLEMLEDWYQKKMREEKERTCKLRLKLCKMQTDLNEKQAESLQLTRRRMEEANLLERKKELKKLLNNIEDEQLKADMEVRTKEADLSKHYVELLKQKTKLEEMISPRKKSRQKMTGKEFEGPFLRKLSEIRNIPCSIAVLQDKLQEIDMEMAKEMANKQQHLQKCFANTKILNMESDLKNLENDVQHLLKKVTTSKIRNAEDKLKELAESITERKHLMQQEKDFCKLSHTLECDNGSLTLLSTSSSCQYSTYEY